MDVLAERNRTTGTLDPNRRIRDEKPIRTLRVGIIGLGVGEKHVEAYLAHPACAVTAICDRDPHKLNKVGAALSVDDRRSCADDILDDSDIDLVSIASHDHDHAHQIIRAIVNGKHVFVEKPLCLTEVEARWIRAALREHTHVQLSGNLILRRSPRMQWLKRTIDEGVFGDLFNVNCAYNYGRLHKLTEGWRGDIPNYSVMLGGGIHLIDMLRWLSGQRIVEVAAFGNNISSRKSGFRRPDMVSAVLRFESGLTGTISANFGCVMPHHHKLEIYGSKATFINDLPHARLYRSREIDAQPDVVMEDHPGANKGDLIASFVDSIIDGTAPEVTVDDVFASLSVGLAIEQALEEHQPVMVEYL